jgi:hypothetical protein
VANYGAVTCLQLRTLNPFRLDILIHEFLSDKSLFTVRHVNALEPVLPVAILLHQRRFPTLHLGVRCDENAKFKPTSKWFLVVDSNSAVLRAKDDESIHILEAYCALRGLTHAKFVEFVGALQQAGWNSERLCLNVNEWRGEW